MYKILAISASTMGTTSSLVIDHIVPQFSNDFSITKFDFKDHELQFADGRDYRDYSESTKELIELILDSDALLISTPIYQSSIPGSLKNMFDLLPINSLTDKVVGIISSAGSEKHFLVPEYQLKPILKYMKAHVIEQYVFLTGSDILNGEIISDDIEIRIERLVDNIQDAVVEQDKKKKAIDASFDF